MNLPRMTVTKTDRNPNMLDHRGSHWRCTFSLEGRRASFHFSMGEGCQGEPKASEVLQCLCSDTQVGEQSFPDFCSEFGYDEDSRMAEKTWKGCRSNGIRLRKLLGNRYEAVQHAVQEA